jgi:hypothetical protein
MRVRWGGLDIFGSRQRPGTGSCEYGNERYGSINYEEFLD